MLPALRVGFLVQAAVVVQAELDLQAVAPSIPSFWIL
jgi:hypothetical protein